ncbi:MAG: bifunctional molybdenum cofactor biosynthesis protein MoaC/MoaB [Bacteroidetes bacterium]|nr:bifunctional molybdenum cofactor biosynthesis protein MoaC/MoaB [Bacteroidota bacterium]
MRDITHKTSTLRYACAQARVRLQAPEAMAALVEKRVPKGDVFEMAKAAALLGIKQTSLVIPDCHPIPVEFAAVSFEVQEMDILVSVEVKTIYKTGVEVEAMYGASVAAITVYDMLKPLDAAIEIQNIRLLEKTGGKTQFGELSQKRPRTAVIVCSDTVSRGKKEDRAGKAILEKLEGMGISAGEYSIIPDEPALIQDKLLQLEMAGFQMLIFCGGTGLAPRDQTPEAVRPLLTREVPGIAEAIRAYGQARMPYAMLSRSVAGFRNAMLVLTLPGSTRGAQESMDAIFPYLLHVFRADVHPENKIT